MVSKEVVQEEGVPCGAVLVSAALLVALVAMSQVATKAVGGEGDGGCEEGDLAGGVQGGDDGEIGRVRSVSSSISLRSSSSQRRFRIFFAGGGTDRDEAWTAIGGDIGRCERGGDVYVEACLGTRRTGSWFTTISPTLTSSGRRWSSRRSACSARIRKATEEVNLFASSVVLDGKA